MCVCMCGMCIHTCTHLHEHTHPSDYCQQKRYRKNKKSQKNPKVGKDQRIQSNLLASSKTSLIKALFKIIIICLLW